MKWDVLWETAQTLVPFLAGRLAGKSGSTEQSSAEAPLQQQTTSMINRGNDEAIQFAVDTAVRNLPDGELHIANIAMVRLALKDHQRTSWREYLGTLVLTERFENIVSSATTRQGGRNNQQGGTQPTQGGQTAIELKFERRPLDYELKPDDPRVMHLVLVSNIVRAETISEEGIAKAKAYLLSAGLISEQSPAEKAAAAAKATEMTVAKTVYSALGTSHYKPTVLRLEQAIRDEPDPAIRQQLERQLALTLQAEVREISERTSAQQLIFRLAVGAGATLLIIISIFWK